MYRSDFSSDETLLNEVDNLIKSGNINKRNSKDGATPFYLIVDSISPLSEERYQALELLIEAGADVNIANHDGFTPLHIASGSNNVRLMKLILDAGADVNVKNNWGMPPLHHTLFNNAVDAAACLLAHGAEFEPVYEEMTRILTKMSGKIVVKPQIYDFFERYKTNLELVALTNTVETTKNKL